MWRQLRVSRQFVRTIRTRPLDHLNRDAPLEGLLSQKGLQMAWFDRAEYYTSKLNHYTKNNPELQEMSLESILSSYSKSANKKDILTYASLLYNLQFSMSSLQGNQRSLLKENEKPKADALLKTPDSSINFANEPITSGNNILQTELETSFGSIVEFRTLLLNSSLAVSGDGFTWLLARKYKNAYSNNNPSTSETLFDKLFIMNTYNAGSPFNFNNGGMMDNLKKEYLNKLKQQGIEPIIKNPELSDIERAKQTAFDDTVYIPLLAIDASPKAWLNDYGVFGKQEYLERVWESINWKSVETRLPKKSSIIYN